MFNKSALSSEMNDHSIIKICEPGIYLYFSYSQQILWPMGCQIEVARERAYQLKKWLASKLVGNV